jgi:hypothetical protein
MLEPAWGHSGVAYMFSFSQWIVFNAQPLAYTPVEIGWDFGNGARVMTAYDIFYYEGMDTDANNPGTGVQRYSYEMHDWRTSLIYRAPWHTRLRPIVGMSVDLVGGDKRLSPSIDPLTGIDANASANAIPAWGYVGLGGLAGIEYLLTQDWSLHLSEHYDFTLNATPPTTQTQLGLMVVF